MATFPFASEKPLLLKHFLGKKNIVFFLSHSRALMSMQPSDTFPRAGQGPGRPYSEEEGRLMQAPFPLCTVLHEARAAEEVTGTVMDVSPSSP